MSDLVVNELTRAAIEDFIKRPSHALILSGPTGSGKSSLATNLATKLLDISTIFENYPYKVKITPDSGSIGIEPIRQLEQFLSLKVPRRASIDRAVIIEEAQTLTLEAQNALLKTLEEPPTGTIIILTVNHSQAVLPTVLSRAQLVDVNRPTAVRLQEHYKSAGFEDKAIKQAFAISGGLPGLMTALLEQADHPLLPATEKARALLQASLYERLIIIDELSRQRDLARDTALIMQQMAHISLQTAVGQAARRWQAVMEAGFAATESLNKNAQPKLVLVNLALAF